MKVYVLWPHNENPDEENEITIVRVLSIHRTPEGAYFKSLKGDWIEEFELED